MPPAAQDDSLTPRFSWSFLPRGTAVSAQGNKSPNMEKEQWQVFLKGLCRNSNAIKMTAKTLFDWFCEYWQKEATNVGNRTCAQVGTHTYGTGRKTRRGSKVSLHVYLLSVARPHQCHGTSKKCLLDHDNRRSNWLTQRQWLRTSKIFEPSTD